VDTGCVVNRCGSTRTWRCRRCRNKVTERGARCQEHTLSALLCCEKPPEPKPHQIGNVQKAQTDPYGANVIPNILTRHGSFLVQPDHTASREQLSAKPARTSSGSAPRMSCGSPRRGRWGATPYLPAAAAAFLAGHPGDFPPGEGAVLQIDGRTSSPRSRIVTLGAPLTTNMGAL
jgi:hypothetical protein